MMRMPATMPVHTPTHGSQQYACFHGPLAGFLTLTAAVPDAGWMLLKREIWTKCALLPGRFAGSNAPALAQSDEVQCW